MGQTNQTVHMIMPSKDNLYNDRKGIGFENSSYFEKAKDLRPTLYDEKVIGLRYTPMFLTCSDEALEIEKFKRSRENKIEFAYDYGNLNASYVNEKINFEDDYFQEIINPDFEKIDSPFQFRHFNSVRRPKHSSIVWKKKGSSNTSNVCLSLRVTILNGNRSGERNSRIISTISVLSSSDCRGDELSYNKFSTRRISFFRSKLASLILGGSGSI
uniref:Uncharacterized protein n=1 Tax=Tanacetum cinerariifolium TaxID=118510 RepID=A0A6L2JJ93_TANCI|nr:hypothetical protein [Tanacetum cinerariifolium]